MTERCAACNDERHLECTASTADVDEDGAAVWRCCCGRTIADREPAA